MWPRSRAKAAPKPANGFSPRRHPRATAGPNPSKRVGGRLGPGYLSPGAGKRAGNTCRPTQTPGRASAIASGPGDTGGTGIPQGPRGGTGRGLPAAESPADGTLRRKNKNLPPPPDPGWGDGAPSALPLTAAAPPRPSGRWRAGPARRRRARLPRQQADAIPRPRARRPARWAPTGPATPPGPRRLLLLTGEAPPSALEAAPAALLRGAATAAVTPSLTPPGSGLHSSASRGPRPPSRRSSGPRRGGGRRSFLRAGSRCCPTFPFTPRRAPPASRWLPRGGGGWEGRDCHISGCWNRWLWLNSVINVEEPLQELGSRTGDG